VTRKSRIGPLIPVLAALVALSLLFVSPALAHHKDGHDGGPPHGSDSSQSQQSSGGGSDHDGDADSDPNTEYTEDNDTNDGGTPNNQPDEGDNRHPSGKDRSVENGRSGNQGKSESDPDGNSNGGRDKPNGSGGLDLADQDGNNGCGNDDDFEDDNNGNCGGRKKDKTVRTQTCPDGSAMPANGKCDKVDAGVITQPPTTCPDGSAMPANGKCEKPVKTCPDGTQMSDDGDCVRGVVIQRPTRPQVEEPSVLGERVSRAIEEPVAVAGAVLPFTGGDVLIFLAVALVLIAAGVFALRVRRSES
jgi:hypothetical protein